MSARTALDKCVEELEDSLGEAVAPKACVVTSQPASALQLVDDAIASLEASLGLQPGEDCATAVIKTYSKQESTGGKRPSKKSGSSKTEGRKGAKNHLPSSPAAEQPDGTKVDFRVGLIKTVRAHESADKLYCEEIEVGEDAPRNIASGLVPHYSLEEMKGRKVVVMCNLKPRNLKGFKSQGMVVCAAGAVNGGKEKVELVEPPEGSAAGEVLYFEGVAGGPFDPVTPAQMEKKKVLDKVLPDLGTDGEGIVKWRGHALVSSCGPCRAPNVRNGPVR